MCGSGWRHVMGLLTGWPSLVPVVVPNALRLMVLFLSQLRFLWYSGFFWHHPAGPQAAQFHPMLFLPAFLTARSCRTEEQQCVRAYPIAKVCVCGRGQA